jgi:glucan 1,3-beta-glucosidase
VSAGGRCGQGCASTTTTPAIVYFPAGTYLISSSIIDYYYTQLLGDPTNLPVLKATAGFSGFGLIDGDKYYSPNLNWISTNVFYRQVRNFVLDMTSIPPTSSATGIHWPTAQATSLQNVIFQMSAAAGTQHVGLFIESGSGGFMTDLTFNGGLIGAQVGNQQFTMRGMTFNNCVTAIAQLWSWGWVYQGLSINNCQKGIDVSASNPSTGSLFVGSVAVIDSSITNTPVGIVTAYSSTSQPPTAGSLILENVALTNVPVAVQSSSSGAVVLAGGTLTIPSWGQGHKYTPSGPVSFQGGFSALSRPGPLLAPGSSSYYTRSKPQYESQPVSAFVSARSAGATGNGVTDDTAALQAAINSATAAGQIVFLDAGTYVITQTLFVPPGARLVGEPLAAVLLASGSFFSDMANPQPLVRVGVLGSSVGTVEWSDTILATRGPLPGAILIEWNLPAPAAAPSGMWDVHIRIGGFAGSAMQMPQCAKTPGSPAVNAQCIGAFMSMHVTSGASGLYMENNWFWVAGEYGPFFYLTPLLRFRFPNFVSQIFNLQNCSSVSILFFNFDLFSLTSCRSVPCLC